MLEATLVFAVQLLVECLQFGEGHGGFSQFGIGCQSMIDFLGVKVAVGVELFGGIQIGDL